MNKSLNYAAQAEKALNKLSFSVDDKYGERELLRELGSHIKGSVHFSLPINGIVFDNSFKGVRNKSIRLPFEQITVEFIGEEGTHYLIYAKETKDNAENILISVCAIRGNGDIWTPAFLMAQIQSNWDDLSGSRRVVFEDEINLIKDSSVKVGIRFFTLFQGLLDVATNEITEEKALKRGMQSMSFCVAPIVSLCEALSCSNVTHEPQEKINPALNARRIRDGKLPFYETRCLVINAGKTKLASNGSGNGNHASPRQHLRRGHIRRLENKNVWVNSCVVAAGSENGKIDKSYSVSTKKGKKCSSGQ